ncbi:glycosyltransferase [Seonamhaeicola marinus]|uniref:Glycosyltransferase n=2 Tax=Seonamhaeicola marinus TaxID=1912246 RepID=A0A5D0HKV9_9FLAO|nr:glycosyltransferase [Seonamhaeicola marinus]
MDHFFWAFNKKCKENNVEIDWFFPNTSYHGDYSSLNIISPDIEITFETFVINKIKGKYVTVFTHFIELCTSFYCQLKKETGAYIIAVDHNPRPLKGYPLKKRFKKRLKGLIYAKHIDKFIGVSEYTTNEILKDFGSGLRNKAFVIYNGVIIDDIEQNTIRNKTNPKFLVVSHLRVSKGIQDLIDAVNLLSDTIKENLRIDIYGEGPYEAELKKKVSQFKLETIFNFKGSVSNLNELYCLYDYMLQPTHMECFSLSILESLAANVPVITTNVGGNEEAVKHGENGYIFEVDRPKELSTLLISIMTGEKYIIENTRNLIKNEFSIDKMVESYFELLST